MKTLLLISLMLLVSCGDKSTPPAVAAAKAIDSKWTSDSGGTIDFTNVPFPGSSTIRSLRKNGVVCDVTMTNTGDKTSGIFTFTYPRYIVGGPSGSSDKDCASFSGSGKYSLANSILTLTDASDQTSVTFHKVVM